MKRGSIATFALLAVLPAAVFAGSSLLTGHTSGSPRFSLAGDTCGSGNSGTGNSGTGNSGTGNSGCPVNLGVGAVRFAPASGQTNSTPGLPVIKDDGAITMDHSWGPDSCDDIASPKSYDYLDCGKPVPSGSLAKNWPVIYAAGDTLTVDQVVFVATGQVTNPQLTATASVTGSATASLSLAAVTLGQAQVGSRYQLTANSLTFTGTLPAVAGLDTLTITWTVTDGTSGAVVQTVTSEHVIYVTAGQFAAPGGVAGADAQPYETVLDTGTVAASGVSGGAKNVFDAIWNQFDTRSILHAKLDPKSGLVGYGRALAYYQDGYSTIAYLLNHPLGSCPDLEGMLTSGTGHCGTWADFLSMVLAFQGVSATAQQGLYGQGNFYDGPDPASGDSPANYAFMLVGPSLWHFSGPTGSGSYPYRDQLTDTSGHIALTGTEVTYSSTSVIAQGSVKTPPMFFFDGDHAIVDVSLPGGPAWVDPSYGNPQSNGYYPDLETYEKTAIAGFAVIYAVTGSGTVPLSLTDDLTDLATYCKPDGSYTCYFQATGPDIP